MNKKYLIILTTLLLIAITFKYIPHNTSPQNTTIPTTISSQAQSTLTTLLQSKNHNPQTPPATDIPSWQKMYSSNESATLPQNKKAATDNQVDIQETALANIPVLDIHPKGWKENHKLIVYVHGGAFTMFSAATTLVLSAPASRVTGERIISINYTTAPVADWQQIQMQIISVMKALLAQGYRMQDIVMFGDSAGGGLVMSAVLQLRDQGLDMPAALVLLSPWSDLTNRGDTMQTLANADPILNYKKLLLNSALAYAHGLELDDPRISPLYANFKKGFPPTLIIEGTRCIFLSSSVRLYQTLDRAKQEVVLDMHEGMWHDFLDMAAPEADEALEKIAAFVKAH